MKTYSLASICHVHGLKLSDLATASSVSLSSIKGIEQAPPRKFSTWKLWEQRLSKWIPLLKFSFLEVLALPFMQDCPGQVISELMLQYQFWADTLYDEHEILREAKKREGKFLLAMHEADEQGMWNQAEKYAVLAGWLFPKHDERWINYQLAAGQFKVNRGELFDARLHIKSAVDIHEQALTKRNRIWEPGIQANAENIIAWSRFLEGQLQASIRRFDNGIELSQLSGYEDYLHTSYHMGARAIMEQDVIGFYFDQIEAPQKHLDRATIEKAVERIELSLDLDRKGSTREAYGLWYMGLIDVLKGDLYNGRKLIQTSERQLSSNGFAVAAASHSQLSQICLDLVTRASDITTFAKCEIKLLDLLSILRTEKYPYAYSQAVIALAYSRIHQASKNRLWENKRLTADLIAVGLISHPHTNHRLWQIGRNLFNGVLLPSWSLLDCKRYRQSIDQRISLGQFPFDYLHQWNIERDSGMIKQLLPTVV